MRQERSALIEALEHLKRIGRTVVIVTHRAAALKVAVYRELRSEQGLWIPAPVDPATALKLEDAILTRARQIRIAALGEGASG